MVVTDFHEIESSTAAHDLQNEMSGGFEITAHFMHRKYELTG